MWEGIEGGPAKMSIRHHPACTFHPSTLTVRHQAEAGLALRLLKWQLGVKPVSLAAFSTKKTATWTTHCCTSSGSLN